MKIDTEIYWDGETIQFVNLPLLLEELREKFKPGYLDGTLQTPWAWKSSQAMGYFWGEIAVKALIGLKGEGYDVHTKEAAVDFIMDNLPSRRWVQEVKKLGAVVKTSVRSVSSLSRSELHELTEEMIRFIQEWFKIDVEEPEAYKLRMKQLKNPGKKGENGN